MIVPLTGGGTVYREIFARLIFAPFTLVASGQNLRLGKCHISYYLSLKTTVSGRIQDWAKLLASGEGQKNYTGQK